MQACHAIGVTLCIMCDIKNFKGKILLYEILALNFMQGSEL